MNEYTVKEFAEREQVTARTVRLWIEKGAVPVRRTPGGGLRIVIEPATASGTANLRDEQASGN
jgi:predicted site-specific integrase-resolvase